MPLDYSKWDALELSDDSDIEVHPNVDKRSFIRAKQNQIHNDRAQRKHEIETLKYEQLINDGFMERIDGLLSALKSHSAEAEKRSPDELIFRAIMESSGDPAKDTPPPRPAGIHENSEPLPTYSKMMATLADQVKVAVEESKPDNKYEAYVKEVQAHWTKVSELQDKLKARLSELEKEEKKKITSETYKTGFDSSHVAKPTPAAPAKKAEKVQAVELLNPKSKGSDDFVQQSSGADADDDEPADEEDVEPTELGKAFAKIKMGDMKSCLQFISANPSVLAERETDGLLVMAFNAAIEKKYETAKQCVHHGLLLQYCRSLGKDGVGLFFNRITTPGHKAQKVFYDDVNDTFERIKSRSKVIAQEREKEREEGAGVEQIQLHAVDPGTEIKITIPEKGSEDPTEIHKRELFESFPPGLQRALESGQLDEVNKVLGKMSVEEAEEIVAQLGEGGMLSLEEQIIDATTEEGQAALKHFEEQEKAAAAEQAAAASSGIDPETGDPE